MANFDIPEKPVFNTEMRRLEPTDPAAAELFNGMFEQLLENDAYAGEHIDSKSNPHGVTAEQAGAEAMAALDDITTETTILETVVSNFNKGIKSARFFSPDNVSDNPEANWSFGIEYFDVGRSLVLVRAYKTQVYRSYFRQIDCNTGKYLYDWVCDFNSKNTTPADVEAITYGTNRVHIQENDDLNNYLEVGCYACLINDVARTVENVPAAKAFILDVLSSTGACDKIDTSAYTYIVQDITTLDGERYYRKVSSSPETSSVVYGNWERMITSASVANNLATTEEGFVLDARQGKALNDKIAVIGTISGHSNTTGTSVNPSTETSIEGAYFPFSGTYIVIGTVDFGYNGQSSTVRVVGLRYDSVSGELIKQIHAMPRANGNTVVEICDIVTTTAHKTIHLTGIHYENGAPITCKGSLKAIRIA